MRRTSIGLGIVLVILVGLDFGARFATEVITERQIQADPQIQVDGAELTIRSFPYVPLLVLAGEISGRIRLEGVTDQGFTVDEFSLDVDGLRFDRADLLEGDVLLTEIDRATVAIAFTDQSISESLGIQVVTSPGQIGVVAGGQERSASVDVDGGVLEIGAPNVGTLEVPLPSEQFLPCTPDVELGDGEIELRCITTEIPPLVNELIGQAVDQGT